MVTIDSISWKILLVEMISHAQTAVLRRFKGFDRDKVLFNKFVNPLEKKHENSESKVTFKFIGEELKSRFKKEDLINFYKICSTVCLPTEKFSYPRGQATLCGSLFGST